MPQEIKITLSMAESAARNIEDNAAQIRSEVQSTYDLLNSLRNTFIGNRATDFFNKFDSTYDTMQEWDDVVRSFSQELHEAAERLRRADNQ